MQRDVSTSLDMTANLLEDRRSLWVIAAFIILLFAVANLPWQLDDYDQAKQAFTSFQMIKEGRWFYQQTPHEHVATKPPLVGWISAAFFAITGSWETAWRLPSFLAAIAIAFLLPGIALFEWRYGRARPLGAPRYSAWSGPPRDGFAVANWWPWIASLAVFLLWVFGGILFTAGFFDQVVMREFVARFGETIHRPQPLYFYLPHLLHKFAPWSVLMIGVAILNLASRRWRIRAAFREMSPETFWLLCWSLGGLIAMSLIPSKRVDRIFPILPPLCLLLAAQIARCNSCSHGSVSRHSNGDDFDWTGHRPVATERKAPHVLRWSVIAVMVAIFFTGGYTVFKVISGYRDHRDALVVFGKNVRHEAEAHHWRYEVVSAKEEGLLLYLRKTHFIEPYRAVIEWNAGNLDALVASTEKAPALLGELRDAALSSLNSGKKEQGRDYVLITH